ncbi:MAG: cytochrome c oxidase subunit II [Planctomycetota bacterium]
MKINDFAVALGLMIVAFFAAFVSGMDYFHWSWMGGDAAWESGRGTDDLYIFIWQFCVFWFVWLMGFVGYFAIKYRRRRGVAPERSPSHHTMLELAWSVIPTIFLVIIFFWGFWGYMDKVVAEGNAEEISLRAWKWQWEMTYPNGQTSLISGEMSDGQVQPYPIFVVPEDYPVKLRMTSDDVIHSFWVPDLRQKFDVFPNRYTSYAFRMDPLSEADKQNTEDMFPGGFRDHRVFCAEYCGDMHAEMAAILRVVSRTDYLSFLDTGGFIPDSPVAFGEKLYTTKGCVACHSIDGAPNTGPTWLNAYGYDVPLASGGTVPYDANYIRESILVPAAKIHAGYPNQMVSYQGRVTDEELDAMIAYIQSLSDRGPQPLSAEGEEGADGETTEGVAPEGEAPAGEGEDAAPAEIEEESNA